MLATSVSIILLNYNTISFTKDCIKSIVSGTKTDYEIIVVENNSDDKERIKEICEEYQRVKVVVSKSNLGFAAGNNLGVKNATGKYIIILNNDTVVYNGTIDNVVKILDKTSKKTIITGFIEGPRGNLQISGGKELKVFAELLRFGLFLIKLIPIKYFASYYFVPVQSSAVREIDWATGCFFALTKEFYEELDGFDENMFMYVEDVEFHKRARLNGGKILFCPEIRIKHFGSQTSKNFKDIILESHYKNTVYYFKKHSGFLLTVFFYVSSKAIFLAWYLVFSFLLLFEKKESTLVKDKRKIYRTLLFA